jgi:hypothetical protein
MAPPGFQDVGYHLCISEEFYIYKEFYGNHNRNFRGLAIIIETICTTKSCRSNVEIKIKFAEHTVAARSKSN